MGEFQKLVRRVLERGDENARIVAMAAAIGGQVSDIAQMMPEHQAQLFVLRIGGITHRRALANRNFRTSSHTITPPASKFPVRTDPDLF